MYYSSFGVLATVLHLIINYRVLITRKPSDTNRPSSCYKHFLLCVTVYYISDILWGLLYERQLIALTYADTVLYFLAMVVSVLLWTRYIVVFLDQKNVFGKILTCTGWVIVVFEIVCLIVNFFFPVVFSFDKDKVYIPGDARYVTLAVQIALFLATAVYTLVLSFRTTGKSRLHHRMIAFSGFVMALFIILQTLFPLLPFYAVGCLIATTLVHTFVSEDERRDYSSKLGTAEQMAYSDPLTGVGNALAYKEATKNVDSRIASGELRAFAVAVFDLNGLKAVNDTDGHDAGDRYIRSACSCICIQFSHSPVFRIGGDEFAAILEGSDYEERLDLLADFERQMDRNQANGLVVVSSGMGEFVAGVDRDFAAVFKRADKRMYERKRTLKDRHKPSTA